VVKSAKIVCYISVAISGLSALYMLSKIHKA
jgi:hypothetical protein